MNNQVVAPFRWTTAAISDAAETLPGDLKALGAHVAHCNGCRERLFSLRCAAESVHDFVAPRFVTTLVLVALVFGVGATLL